MLASQLLNRLRNTWADTGFDAKHVRRTFAASARQSRITLGRLVKSSRNTKRQASADTVSLSSNKLLLQLSQHLEEYAEIKLVLNWWIKLAIKYWGVVILAMDFLKKLSAFLVLMRPVFLLTNNLQWVKRQMIIAQFVIQTDSARALVSCYNATIFSTWTASWTKSKPNGQERASVSPLWIALLVREKSRPLIVVLLRLN